MSKVFVEYQILPQHRSVYSSWVQNVRAKSPDFELLEGTDQPGLFIEIWDGLNQESYELMKKIRKGDECVALDHSESSLDSVHIDWRKLDLWIQGGSAKINIWHFSKVR